MLSNQRSLKTLINLLYSIYPDRKQRFGIEEKWIYRFKMVYFWLGRYCTNQLISLSEFPVIYGQIIFFIKIKKCTRVLIVSMSFKMVKKTTFIEAMQDKQLRRTPQLMKSFFKNFCTSCWFFQVFLRSIHAQLDMTLWFQINESAKKS